MIVVAVVLLNYFINYLFGWDVGSDLTDGSEGYLEYLGDPLVETSAFILFLPWDLRRMKDAGINLLWRVVFEILWRLPEPPAVDGTDYIGHNAAHWIFSVIPYAVFGFIHLFKPGQAFKDFLRNGPVRKRGGSRVTFSE